MIGPVHHHGIVVSDLDRAIEFYRDVLGFDLERRFEADPEAFGQRLGVGRAPAELAFLDAGSVRVELETHENTGESTSKSTQPTDVGVAHLCLEVDDIDRVYHSLEDDTEFLSPPGRASDSGARIVYLHDPDGNLIELIELPDE
jgi:catechol 2,3-dioxygenase-like lactoylglutathione lyase family enzyme